MGLMRALTLKRSSLLPSRSNTTLKGRPQISLPTELISTTNNLSYTAPSVESMQQQVADLANAASETSSLNTSTPQHLDSPSTPSTPRLSEEDDSRRSSHLSTTSGTGSGSAPSLTDASSVSSSPVTPFAHSNLLSTASAGYFSTDSFSKPSSRASTISFLDDAEIDPLTVVVPTLPRRAPSHSKREHERLARRRSQRASMKPVAVISAWEIEQDVLSPAPLSAAITMPELLEVDEEVMPAVTIVEVAEELVEEETKTLEQLLQEMVAEDEESCYMREHNLKRFSVGGYLDIVGDVWESEVLMVEGCAVVIA